MTDSIGSQSSPLSVSLRGRGNDIFLHWMANCKGHDKEKLIYSFPQGESMHDQMRADICHSLFGSQQESTLLALLRHNESTEAIIYRYTSQLHPWAGEDLSLTRLKRLSVLKGC